MNILNLESRRLFAAAVALAISCLLPSPGALAADIAIGFDNAVFNHPHGIFLVKGGKMRLKSGAVCGQNKGQNVAQ